MGCLSCSIQHFEEKCRKFRELISTTTSNLPSLISEEMLVVDQSVSWQDKLFRLKRIIEGYDVTILTTIRSPIKATFSLYVELYSSINKEYPSFDQFVKESNQAKIFSYKKLYLLLEEYFGKKNISTVPFELLKTGEFVKEILAELESPLNIARLPYENTQKKTTQGVITRPVTIQHWIRKALNGPRLSLNYYIGLFLKLIGLSKNRTICPWGRKHIPYPDFESHKEIFLDSNQWFLDHYSIDYVRESEKRVKHPKKLNLIHLGQPKSS